MPKESTSQYTYGYRHAGSHTHSATDHVLILFYNKHLMIQHKNRYIFLTKNFVKLIESMAISNEVSFSSEVECIVNAVSKEVAFSYEVA